MQLLKGLNSSSPVLQDFVPWLTAWNCDVSLQSPQAALYEVWLSRHLTPAIIDRVQPSLPPVSRKMVTELNQYSLLGFLEQPDSTWGEDPVRARNELLSATLLSAIADIRQLLGTNRSAWSWGSLAKTVYTHRLTPFANEEERSAMNLAAIAKAGDYNTVGVGHYNEKTFETDGTASFRMVLDVGDWDTSMAVNSPGQSGSWVDSHYRDLASYWSEGRYFPLLFTRAAVEKGTEQKILLVP
jgi:penicillin amidase